MSQVVLGGNLARILGATWMTKVNICVLTADDLYLYFTGR